MNELQIFNYHGKEIRTVEKDSEICWVLKDVCDAFGVTSYRDVAARLDDDEKGVGEIATPGGMQKLTIVNQPRPIFRTFYNATAQSTWCSRRTD